MKIDRTLLPPNESTHLKALDVSTRESIQDRVAIVDVNPQTCDAKILPYLKQNVQVVFWDKSLDEQSKRNLIEESPVLHRHIGTPWAVMRALELTGLSSESEQASIQEGLALKKRDGSHTYNALFTHFDKSAWAEYIVRVAKPIAINKVNMARGLIQAVAPAGARLKAIVYNKLLSRDGGAMYDANFTHGSIGVANG